MSNIMKWSYKRFNLTFYPYKILLYLLFHPYGNLAIIKISKRHKREIEKESESSRAMSSGVSD